MAETDTTETEEDVCTQPVDEDKPAKETFSGTIAGGLVIEKGLICHVPDDWPFNILPSYKDPCSKCGQTCECLDKDAVTEIVNEIIAGQG